MGDINYDIAATLLIALNIFLFYFRRRPRGLQSDTFAILLWTSLATTLIDVFSVLANRQAATLPLWSLYIVNMLYYLLINALPLIFALYTLAFTSEWPGLSRLRQLLVFLPWLVVSSLILTTPLTGLAFGFGPDSSYQRGPALPFFYLAALWYIVFGVSRPLTYSGVLPKRMLSPLMAFVVFSLLPIFIQFFFPQLLLQCMGVAVFEFFILITVQNPDEYIEADTGLHTRNAFSNYLNLAAKNATSLHLALITVENTSFLKHRLGLSSFYRIMGDVGRHILTRAGGSGGSSSAGCAARLGDSRFALALPRSSSHLDILRSIQERFSQTWAFGQDSVVLSARICSLDFPK